jgi:hypothetical protein
VMPPKIPRSDILAEPADQQILPFGAVILDL